MYLRFSQVVCHPKKVDTYQYMAINIPNHIRKEDLSRSISVKVKTHQKLLLLHLIVFKLEYE